MEKPYTASLNSYLGRTWQEQDPTRPIATHAAAARDGKQLLLDFVVPANVTNPAAIEALGRSFDGMADYAIKHPEPGFRGTKPAFHLQLIPNSDADMNALTGKLISAKLLTPNPHGEQRFDEQGRVEETNHKLNLSQIISAAHPEEQGRFASFLSRLKNLGKSSGSGAKPQTPDEIKAGIPKDIMSQRTADQLHAMYGQAGNGEKKPAVKSSAAAPEPMIGEAFLPGFSAAQERFRTAIGTSGADQGNTSVATLPETATQAHAVEAAGARRTRSKG